MYKLQALFLSHRTHRLFTLFVSLCAGILWQSHNPTILMWIVAVTVLVIISESAAGSSQFQISIVLAMAAFSYGAASYQYQMKQREKFWNAASGLTLDIEATIVSINELQHKRFQQSMIVKTTSKPIEGKQIQIYTTNNNNVEPDDQVVLHGITLKKPRNKEFSLHLIREGCFATIFTTKNNFQVIKNSNSSLRRTIHKLRSAIQNKLKSKLNPQAFAFFSRIFMGNKQERTADWDDLKQGCQVWGISHYLARSGLHLIAFILLWELLLQLIPLGFIPRHILMLLLSVVYFLLSYSGISFTRSFVVSVLYRACAILNLQGDLFHLLTIAGLSILLLNPVQILFLDFQMSFALTFSLVWLNRIQQKRKVAANTNC